MANQSSGWQQVNSGGSSGVDGTWLELIASTSFASSWMMVYIMATIAQSNTEFDIAIGGAGSEVEIVSDQFFRVRNQSGGIGTGVMYSFPMTVAIGTRISIRFKDTEVARTYFVVMNVTDQVVSATIPNGAASSGFKNVTSGNVVDNFGAWIELVASLSSVGLWMCCTCNSYLQADGQRFPALWDIGTGAAGSESVIISDVGFRIYKQGVPQTGKWNSSGYSFPMNIPAGSRVAVRIRDDSSGQNVYQFGAFILTT